MNYQFLCKCLSLLSIIILRVRASAGESGFIDYQANSGDGNADSQAKTTGDVTQWLMAEGASYNSADPVQDQFYEDGQANPFLVSDNEPCSMQGTDDVQGGSSSKGSGACKNESPPPMPQRITKPPPAHEDIVPDAMPPWPIMQLKPNRQKCDHEIYSVPACAKIVGARFISLLSFDLPVCRPCMLLLHS